MNTSKEIQILYTLPVTIITVVFLFIIIALSGLLSSCSVGGELLGPSDSQLRTAEEYAMTLPDDHPDKSSAVRRVETLRRRRTLADERVNTAAGALNYVLPGAGALLGIAYGITQRLRGRQNRTALEATIDGIETFKKSGGARAVRQLVDTLAVKQDQTGTRDAVRQVKQQITSKT